MKTYTEILLEIREIQNRYPGGIYFIDMDDTLFKTGAQVQVVHKKSGEIMHVLSPSDYNNHKLHPDHDWNYDQFRDAQIFHDTAQPIKKGIDRLQYILRDDQPKAKVIILTARADFHDKELFLKALAMHGIDLDKVYVERAGNLQEARAIAPPLAKAIIIRTYLKTGKFHKAVMIDDSLPNLEKFMELGKEFPNVEFHAWHSLEDGEIRIIH